MASNDSEESEQLVENKIVETWKREQIELKKKLETDDCINWGVSSDEPFSELNLIGGVDISFPKGDADHACACLIVLSFPDLKNIWLSEKLNSLLIVSPDC